jgi:hypothetical protein
MTDLGLLRRYGVRIEEFEHEATSFSARNQLLMRISKVYQLVVVEKYHDAAEHARDMWVDIEAMARNDAEFE